MKQDEDDDADHDDNIEDNEEGSMNSSGTIWNIQNLFT